MKKTNNLTIITIKEEEITDFSAVRNRELGKAKTDWVMFLDSDETISPELGAEIKGAIQSSEYSAYRFRRLDTFLGRELKNGENARNSFVRLARRDWGAWNRPVHEVWVGPGSVGSLDNPILHPPHASISSFLQKINTYSTLEAEYRQELGKKSSLWRIAVFPPAKFIRNYFCCQGFRDGVPGTIMAIMMSFHSFLTWTKLFLLHQKQS